MQAARQDAIGVSVGFPLRIACVFLQAEALSEYGVVPEYLIYVLSTCCVLLIPCYV
jgi:hypothetical protein